MYLIAAKTGFDTYIATDSIIIKNISTNFTKNVILTPKKLNSGTERVLYTANKIKKYDVYINLQCDEPMIEPNTIKKVALVAYKTKCITTAYCISKDLNEFLDPNRVKVVIDKDNFAIYFSRAPIPYQKKFINFKKHIGIYAFPKFLIKEIYKIKCKDIEDLEQNSWILNRYKIKMVKNPYTHSIDVYEDIAIVEKLLNSE